MTLEEARDQLRAAGLAAVVIQGNWRSYLRGGSGQVEIDGLKIFTFPEFSIFPSGDSHTEPDRYKADTTILGHREGDWEYGDLGHCVEWVIARVAQGPSMRELASRAVEANERRNAELAAMTPEDRECAIKRWAEDLADECSELDD